MVYLRRAAPIVILLFSAGLRGRVTACVQTSAAAEIRAPSEIDLPAFQDWKLKRRGIPFAFGIIGSIIAVWSTEPKTVFKKTAQRSRSVHMLMGGFTAALFISNSPVPNEILTNAVAMGAMWQTILQGFFNAAHVPAALGSGGGGD